MRFNKLNKRLLDIVIIGLLSFLLSPLSLAANIDNRVFNFQHKLAVSGNVSAQYKLAIMYEMGRGVNKDTKKASEWYSKAALKGNHAARHRLTYITIKNSGFNAKHRPWLNKIKNDALNGDSEALFLLAELYQNGTGVKANLDKARHYYKLSTAKGNANAELQLYIIVQKINKIRKDKEDKKAQALARKKAAAQKEKEVRNREIANEKRKQAKIKAAKLRKAKERDSNTNSKLYAEKKRKLENQRLAKLKSAEEARIRAESEKTTANNEEEVYESDLCSGAAARFRTQCN